MKGITSLILLMVMGTTLVFAQTMPEPNKPQGENLKVPEGWNVRLDRADHEAKIGANPDSADIYFVNMTPGWHITTGPAGIFYHPAMKAMGEYKLHANMYYFDPKGRNREGYGVFMAGSELDGDGQSYIYFLLRNTGDFLIKERLGEETNVIKAWTPSEAIKVYAEGEEASSVKNELLVEVSDEMITFYINEKEVASIKKEGIKTDGVFGLRLNHSVNLHISDLSLVD